MISRFSADRGWPSGPLYWVQAQPSRKSTLLWRYYTIFPGTSAVNHIRTFCACPVCHAAAQQQSASFDHRVRHLGVLQTDSPIDRDNTLASDRFSGEGKKEPHFRVQDIAGNKYGTQNQAGFEAAALVAQHS
ncbi:hypothetical protein CMQ_2604 [Grosmannia clavigera kw1407]|uniref:Uncharacterized protein n=1 Tax=Grosmannia clavigera (strain kw1407 / UAMH 11150) TaxID=655863 RepID=F0XHW9_GROCL|nr:uncharacterized protein CMQ_2604 [Grosmannia clavigera kw1407]EFX02675.1 hypothetical protein CMQ_2604 [Grosmannia clavigera kw1407]